MSTPKSSVASRTSVDSHWPMPPIGSESASMPRVSQPIAARRRAFWGTNGSRRPTLSIMRSKWRWNRNAQAPMAATRRSTNANATATFAPTGPPWIEVMSPAISARKTSTAGAAMVVATATSAASPIPNTVAMRAASNSGSRGRMVMTNTPLSARSGKRELVQRHRLARTVCMGGDERDHRGKSNDEQRGGGADGAGHASFSDKVHIANQ